MNEKGLEFHLVLLGNFSKGSVLLGMNLTEYEDMIYVSGSFLGWWLGFHMVLGSIELLFC